jgi:hypothetical protein
MGPDWQLGSTCTRVSGPLVELPLKVLSTGKKQLVWPKFVMLSP